ncbi:MAG: metallophosphoesterase family protein [Polyangiaceae bacterium]
MRRIGLIGDVHTNDELLERALVELRALGAERSLCVGDITDGPGDVLRCCELLSRERVASVRGNHDRWLLTDLSRLSPSAPPLPSSIVEQLHRLRDETPHFVEGYLTSLATTLRVETPLGDALLCHGLGDNDMASLLPEQEVDPRWHPELFELQTDSALRLVLNGHSHRRMVRQVGALTIVNAGTLHREHEPGCVLIDFEDRTVIWLDLSLDRTTQSILGALPTLASL